MNYGGKRVGLCSFPLKWGWSRAREQEAWGLSSNFQYDLFSLAFDRIIAPHLLFLSNPAFFLALFALLPYSSRLFSSATEWASLSSNKVDIQCCLLTHPAYGFTTKSSLGLTP